MKKLLLLSALLIFACSTDSEGNPCIYEPTLTTEAATDITETSATLNGVISIVSENCEVPNNTEQGFVYSTEIQPTLEDTQVNVNGINISTTIEGLNPNTTYYVRAFLTNNFGDFYGDEVSFSTTEVPCGVVYLAENGITIKACPDANVGDIGTVNGIEYTVVDRNMLDQMIENEEDVTKVCTSRITLMNELFLDKSTFNQPIGNWDVSSVTSMGKMFSRATSFNQPIGDWDVSNVVVTFQMFSSATSFNQPIGDWDVSNVGAMDYMFSSATSFNQPIGDWDVSNVFSIAGMFEDAYTFNQPIGDWDVSNVSNMSFMFKDSPNGDIERTVFNQPIGDWDVSNVLWIDGMFSRAEAFNQDISNWDTSSVTNMSWMFYYSSDFNQDIGNWDTSSVTNMEGMFRENPVFNQDLSNWNVDGVTDCNNFSYLTPQWTLPQPNFTNCSP